MWNLDWFAAREEAQKNGKAIRRGGWERGTWLAYRDALWWLRLPDLSWRVVEVDDFGESDFRARDWTTETYRADVCGSLPAFNSTPPPSPKDWGDVPTMTPLPVPNYPDDLA